MLARNLPRKQTEAHRHQDINQTPVGSYLENRLTSFLALEDGWADGQGAKFAPAGIKWLGSALNHHLPEHLAKPQTNPTADGEIRLEWNQSNQVIILEADLQSHQAYYLWFDTTTKADQEASLNLDLKTDWRWLINQLESKIRHQE